MLLFGFVTVLVLAREYKSREVAQSPIYVIVHSLLEVSFCTQPFPTPSGGLWSLWFLTLIGCLHVKGREWTVGKGRSRGLLLKDGIGRGGKLEGRGREERKKKGRGATCPNNKNSFPRHWPISINLAAQLKCHRRHGP